MRRTTRVTAALIALTIASRPANASVFGEENAALSALVAQGIQEITQLSTIITNIKAAIQTANEMLAIAREAQRVYQMIANYSWEDLQRDAKAGLYEVFPDLREIELQSKLLIENGRAMEQGYGPFFSRYTVNDRRMERVTKAMWRHAISGTIWPIEFREAMKNHSEPSPVERLLEERFVRTEDQVRRAVQNTGMEILSRKVKAYVKDAESKNEAPLKTAATNVEVNYQSMRDGKQLLNLREQDVAIQEAGRLQDARFYNGFRNGLRGSSRLLFDPGPVR